MPERSSVQDRTPKKRLCSHCTALGIGSTSFSTTRMTEDHLQHILDRVDNLDCASCELIGSALPFNTLPLPSRGNNSGRIASNDLPILQPLHGIEIRSGDDDRRLYGTLVSQKSGTTYSTIIAEVMDFGLLATWLEKCKQQHKQGCGQRDLAKRHSMAIEILLIDVDRNCIASKTTASRYFALSYVWGDAITTTTTMQNLAQFEQPGSLKQNLTLPKTVTDAMELTRKMGVQYLWVDCLSIIQDSPKKHQDIINMDIVYSQAELTIVAVSGTDANSGLPGVQRRTRRQRVLSKTQKAPGLYFKLPDSKYKLLDGTKYSKRGWTFQELLLSRRVLFVTEHQATFHCDTSWCSESFPRMTPYNGGEYGGGVIDLRTKRSLDRTHDDILRSYYTMVQEYSWRRLSFQEDLENAFSGLASVLGDWCKGAPVINGMLSSYFGHSMLWTFQEYQSYSSPYSIEARGKRRHGFPSWSWVGWIACVSNIDNTFENFDSISALELPLYSWMENVEILLHDKGVEKPISLDITDKLAEEVLSAPTKQRIRINLEPARLGSVSDNSSILTFDAERTDWTSFSVEPEYCHTAFFPFSSAKNTSRCGFFFIAPNEQVINDLFQAKPTTQGLGSNWSLVRLYQTQLKTWDNKIDQLQLLLEQIEDGADKKGSAAEFRISLQQSDLLFVLLIRRCGVHWERMGSGLMLQNDWPSNNMRANARIFQERISMV